MNSFSVGAVCNEVSEEKNDAGALATAAVVFSVDEAVGGKSNRKSLKDVDDDDDESGFAGLG